MAKKRQYPTWKRMGRGLWHSQEGMPNGYGKWTPDFLLEKDPGTGEWLGKMRTSAKWHRFESSAEGKLYFERAMVRS